MDSIFFSDGYFTKAGAEEVRAMLGSNHLFVATDGSRETVLHRAAADSHAPDVFGLVLDHAKTLHIDVSSPMVNGWTPLHMAAQWNWEAEVIKRLLRAGADVNAQDIWQVTPLHKAVGNHESAIVETLLEWNANVKAVDSRGWTPLHHAASLGSKLDVVKMLLRYEANKEATTNDGETPCQIAQNAQAPEEVIKHLCTEEA